MYYIAYIAASGKQAYPAYKARYFSTLVNCSRLGRFEPTKSVGGTPTTIVKTQQRTGPEVVAIIHYSVLLYIHYCC